MKTDQPSARASRRSASLHGLFTFLLFVLILVCINILGFKYYVHRDLSQSQFYTLSPKTKDVLRHLEAPVTAYTLLPPKNPDPVLNLLEEYERVGGKNFKVEKIDPAYDPARAAQLQKDLQFDGNESLVIFQYKGQTRFIKEADLFDVNPMTQQVGAFKGEQEFTGALVSLVEGKASKVYFTVGHGEHSIHDTTTLQGYGVVAQSIKNDNIDATDLNIAEKGEIPADADAVVIAGPSVSLSPFEVQALDHYLSNNGKLFVLVDPYVVLGFDTLLQRYGLKIENDLVLDRFLTTTGQQITYPLALIREGGFSSHPITTKFAQANLQLEITDARSITLANAKGQPNPKTEFLLQTDANAWGWVSKGGPLPADPRALTFNKATDIPGPLTVAAEYDGGTVTDPKTQAIVPATRIVVVGSSKFVKNDVAQTVGLNFFTNCVDWLVKKKAVLDIAPKIPQQYGISLSPMQGRTLGWVSLFFIPGAALVCAFLTWFSRRK